MRLYLLDLPGGSTRTLTIAIVASGRDFERVVEAAAPILDSFEFHAPAFTPCQCQAQDGIIASSVTDPVNRILNFIAWKFDAQFIGRSLHPLQVLKTPECNAL